VRRATEQSSEAAAYSTPAAVGKCGGRRRSPGRLALNSEAGLK